MADNTTLPPLPAAKNPRPPLALDAPAPCARCRRETRVAWLIVIIAHPSAPVTVGKCCATCAGEVRYAPPERQHTLCAAIVRAAPGEEVSAA